MFRLISALLVAALAGAGAASAHGGGTDARGCHYDHQRGGYHCH